MFQLFTKLRSNHALQWQLGTLELRDLFGLHARTLHTCNLSMSRKRKTYIFKFLMENFCSHRVLLRKGIMSTILLKITENVKI